MRNIFFLSYPSSGTHWVLYCIEKISKVKTVWQGVDRRVFDEPHTIHEDNQYLPNIKITATHLCWKENEEAYTDNLIDGTIMIVRNYKETIIKRLTRGDENDLSMDKIKKELEGSTVISDGINPHHDYVRLLRMFHTSKKPKLLIYYEDLITNPKETIIKVIKFLNKNFGVNYNEDEINNFIKNIELNKKDSLNRYTKVIEKPVTNGGTIIHHSNKITTKEKLEIDNYFKDKHPTLFDYYVKQFSEKTILDEEYDEIIPIGWNCRIATALDKLDMRDKSLPLDWGFFSWPTVCELFRNDFKDYLNKDFIKIYTHKDEEVLDNFKYNATLPHEGGWSKEIKEKYDRRISRLLDILNSNKRVLFVRNLMDCHVNDDGMTININKHEKVFGNLKKGSHHVYEFDKIIKEKSPTLKYNILCVYYDDKKVRESDDIVTYKFFDKSKYKTYDPYDHYAFLEIFKGVKLKR